MTWLHGRFVCNSKVQVAHKADLPLPDPTNEDNKMRPPTKYNMPISPKHVIKETFDQMECSGKWENMGYVRKLIPQVRGIKIGTCHQQGRQIFEDLGKEMVYGGPNELFLKL